jgi:lipopolysaccharide transport system permease protein
MHHQNQTTPNQKIIIYEPNHIIKIGIRVWQEMFRELLQNRGLIWRLIVRDISARYKQSFLGVFWAFFTPLVMMLTFVWVKNRNILPIGDTAMPYASFVFLGQVVWLLFSHGVTTTANSFVAAGTMLTKINFPKEVLVISAVGQAVFDFLLRLPLLAIVFWWTGFFPQYSLILMPVALIPMLFLILGIGYLVALLNAIFRDIGSLIGILLNLGMFATPVIYPPPQSWPLSFWINIANPVSGYVNGIRDLATNGYFTQPDSYLFAVVFSLLLFLIGWRLMHLFEPKIAERV